MLFILILLATPGEPQVTRAQTAVLDKFVYLPLVKRSK